MLPVCRPARENLMEKATKRMGEKKGLTRPSILVVLYQTSVMCEIRRM